MSPRPREVQGGECGRLESWTYGGYACARHWPSLEEPGRWGASRGRMLFPLTQGSEAKAGGGR